MREGEKERGRKNGEEGIGETHSSPEILEPSNIQERARVHSHTGKGLQATPSQQATLITPGALLITG